MLRRFLLLSVGGIALLVVLGAPGQLQAQHFRRGLPHAAGPVFPGGLRPGFPARFDPRFNFGSFGPGLNRAFLNPGFNREFFVPRFSPGFNRGLFDPRFSPGFFDPRFNRGFFDPRSSLGFGPVFVRPF